MTKIRSSPFERACFAAWFLAVMLLAPGAQAQARGPASLDARDGPSKLSAPESPHMRFAPEREDAPRYQVQRVDPRTLVVYRTRTDRPGLEGFLLDVPDLLATLQKRVLGGRGLDEVAQLRMAPEQPTTRDDVSDHYRFDYRFSEPFRAVRAELWLAPLDDTGERRLLIALASSLALAIVLGLFALYRMSAVQMQFAARRENFVSAVSHELKTPLTAIRMYGEILREGLVESDEKRSEYYGLISSESERLSRLVQNVLDLSRIERGERLPDLVVGDVESVVRAAVQVLAAEAQQRGFTIDLSVQGALPRARFNADALKQLVFNLLDNAFKYAREGESLRVCVGLEPGERVVRLTVRDFGPGVPEADLRRIFEPFYRAQSELTRSHQGVGLGLSLVQRLVAAMGGSVRAEAARPGLRVIIELPRA
jgi:signal transduction histidine kinase